MKKLIIAIFFFIPFIAQSQEIPPAYFNPTDSSIYITKLISGVVTRYKYKLQPASNPIPISTLLAATGTNTINNAAFVQEWQWNSIVSDAGLFLSSTSTAANAGQKLFQASLSGANSNSSQTTYSGYFTNTHTGTSSTNTALLASASGGTTNVGVQIARGSLNIGTTGQESGVIKLLGSTSGTITIQPAAAAGTYTLTLPTNDGDAGQFLQTDGSGVMTWVAAAGGSMAIGGTVTSAIAGSVFFAGTGGILSQKNADFFYDSTNSRLGIGTALPQHDIHIKRASAPAILDIETTSATDQVQLRLVTNSGVWRFMNGSSGSGVAGSLSIREENFAQNPIVIRSGADGMGVGIGSATAVHSAASATLYVTGSAVGINNSNTTPTAQLKIGAGSASASTAPLKLTSGTINTTAEAGAVEYNGTHYITKASGLRIALEGTIADFYTDVNNGTTVETDIYSYTTPASTLGADGEKIFFAYTLNLSDVTATATIKCYFAGTSIANTGALTVSATGAVLVQGWIVRTAATTARASVNISSPTASTAVYTSQTDLTGLTLSGTNIVKVTAQAGGAGGGSNDITGKSGTVSWRGAAAN